MAAAGAQPMLQMFYEKLLQAHTVPVGRRWHSNRRGAAGAPAHRQTWEAAGAVARGHFLFCSAFFSPDWIIGFRL
jgi:hypothetical protein